jgi:imidazolonepropionase-like amidohydrolase
MATLTPATVLGLEKEIGSVEDENGRTWCS